MSQITINQMPASAGDPDSSSLMWVQDITQSPADRSITLSSFDQRNVDQSLQRQFATVALLRANTGTPGATAVVQGYYAAGDGGGGPLRHWAYGAAAGTYVDNGGSVIVPIGGDGSAAWLMPTLQEYYLRWFDTAAHAVGAVPEGGTLVLDGVLDVATYGRIYSTKPINIVGKGWNRDGGVAYGAQLINTGSDTIDSPMIELDVAATGIHATVSDVALSHEGTTSYAIRINNCTHTRIRRVWINNDDLGFGCISVEGNSFLFYCDELRAEAFIGTCASVTSTGREFVFRDVDIQTAVASATGIYTETGNTRVIRGEIHLSGTGTNYGVHFYANGADVYGGLVEDVFYEGLPSGSYGVYVDGSGGRFRIVNVVRVNGNLNALASSNQGTMVYFGNCANCSVLDPKVYSSGGAAFSGSLAEWSANAQYCTISHSSFASAQAPVTVNASALNPFVRCNMSLDTTDMDLIATDANLRIELSWNSSFNSSALWDGTLWYPKNHDRGYQSAVGASTSFGVTYGNILFLNPDGAASDGTLSISSTANMETGYKLVIYNRGATYNLIFSPTSTTIAPGAAAIFYLSGSTWYKVV